MKVFMVHEDPWNAGNPYIYTLIEGIQKSHPDCSMGWGRERFWSEEIFSYDIVHFHWPQTFMGRDSHTEDDLLLHIERMKSSGVRIVATCHDLEPHYDQFADKVESMRIVYSHCDAIFHLGNYSKKLFEIKYPNAVHYLLPHHLYDTVYTKFPSREESLKKLGLAENHTYILCFGAFRAQQERNLILSLSKQLADKKIVILAPSFMNVWWHSFRLFHKRLVKWYYRCRYHIYCTGSTWRAVSDEFLPYYYGAADIVFIPRLKILNSGNALMPMLFGKVVVGPDCGNVGPLLRQWNYPVFSVDDVENVGSIVRSALQMGKNGAGAQNRPLQLDAYSTAVIADKLFTTYMNVAAL
ncbi:hypothetical protein [Xylanibacter brevis]|uniref:hypothetical protein n=1 Tax=Xylanibacter brevis TaxID=83231 RepID=UPI0004822522|nr:hypothetical protein [Xylanibacter brevis]